MSLAVSPVPPQASQEKRVNEPAEVDPAYLWNAFMGRIPPTLSVCQRCGEELRDDSDWWCTNVMGERYGSIFCPDGKYHHSTPRKPGETK